MRHILSLTACLAIASPALAAPDSPAATEQAANPAPAAPSSEEDKKICHSVVATGSIMPRRVCMTRKMWAQVSAQMTENSERALSNKGGLGTGGATNR